MNNTKCCFYCKRMTRTGNSCMGPHCDCHKDTGKENKVEKIVDFIRSAGSFELRRGMLDKWKFKRGNDEYFLADWLRSKLTSLLSTVERESYTRGYKEATERAIEILKERHER